LYRIVISTAIEKGGEEDRAKWNSQAAKRALGGKLKHLINKLRFELIRSGKAINYSGVIVSTKTANRRKEEVEKNETTQKRKLREIIHELDQPHSEWLSVFSIVRPSGLTRTGLMGTV
jgi:hypothetical protein